MSNLIWPINWAVTMIAAIILLTTLLDVKENNQALQEEIAIRDSWIEDLCTAIDEDEANFRTSCEYIKDANDRGRGR